MSMDGDGGTVAPQILVVLVLVAVFAGILFAMWLFGVMTAA
jgi:hypothetical protein